MDRDYENSTRCYGELARACVPFQVMNEVFDSREALRKGTLFPELYKPYIVDENRDRGGKYCG